jgi:asparagine synthase (glutamine-hydrolysing)
MSGFVCIGANLDQALWRRKIDLAAKRQFGEPLTWYDEGQFTFGLSAIGEHSQLVAQCGDYAAIGHVRLDNSAVIAAEHHETSRQTHLSLVLRMIARRGIAAIEDVQGTYALVIIDRARRRLVAARDMTGVQPLYWRHVASGQIVVGTHGALLALDGTCDSEYLAYFLVHGVGPEDRSVFGGVNSVKPGCGIETDTTTTVRHTVLWRPPEPAHISRADELAAIAKFRGLFTDAVRNSVAGEINVWSMLSGGVDSSSIVVMVTELARTGVLASGLRGSVSVVDTISRKSDERRFSDMVARACAVANHKIVDYDLWQDDDEGPPLVDEPYMMYPFYARDRAIARMVRRSGATVLLSGYGADHYLTGNKYFLADLIAQGALRQAAREAIDWSIARRTSVWRTTYKYGLFPLLPTVVRCALEGRRHRIPQWITAGTRRAFDLDSRAHKAMQLAAKRGHQYDGEILWQLKSLGQFSRTGMNIDGLEIRYPFLYRPLVDYSLALPYWLRTRPYARKWIHRQALADLLPEPVRTRRTKGTTGVRLRSAIAHDHGGYVRRLLDAPILADLGLIEPKVVHQFIRRVERGTSQSVNELVQCLSLEFWLRVQSGRWAVRTSLNNETSAEVAVGSHR